MPASNSLLASRTNWRIAWEMSSPAADVPVTNDRSIWRKLDALALLSPVVVVVWMLVMARASSGSIRLDLPHFRNFYFWNALGLAGLAWGLGLLVRGVRRELGVVTMGISLVLMVGVCALAGVSMSQIIVRDFIPLFALAAFYLGMEQMGRQERGAQSLTVMVGAFFGAVVWIALRSDDPGPVGMIVRGWMAMGCFAAVWLGLRTPHMARPLLQLPQSVVGGYLFAVAIGIPSLAWDGEIGQLLRGEGTLMVAMVMGLTLWVRRMAVIDEGPERTLLVRLIPLSFCAALGLLYPLWMASPGSARWLWGALGGVLVSLLVFCVVHRKFSASGMRAWLWLTWVVPVVLIFL